MKAVDTNVLLRALVRNDEAQFAIAVRVLDDGAFVPLTVLLETAWVLRSRYAGGRSEVADRLLALLSLPNVTCEHAVAVQWALLRSRERGDIADLMHVASSIGTTAFVTFDRSIAAAAHPDSPIPVETLA